LLVQKLILWDIDGTLLTTGGVAANAMREALAQIFGDTPVQERSSYAGKTDRQILLDALPHLSSEAVFGEFERFGGIYLDLLTRRRDDLLARSKCMPGATQTLQQLQGRAYQAVLTGNMAAIARHKLAALELLHYLDLEASAFGSDHHERPQLLPIAAQRASRRYGRSFAGADIVIVGDTPNDILCGRSGGARTVAVATGPFSVEELQACEPDVVLPNLEHPGAIAAILGE
jgi:phosphoglycolate phosphatase-like HAD superfamily hydrolase